MKLFSVFCNIANKQAAVSRFLSGLVFLNFLYSDFIKNIALVLRFSGIIPTHAADRNDFFKLYRPRPN